MLKFLLNANLSHETAQFLNSLGCDAKTAAQFGLGGAEDAEIAEKAIKEERILVTFDLDFGEIFYFSEENNFWVIVLRLRDQTVESVNKIFQWLLSGKILDDPELQNTLMIVEEGRIKVRRKP